MGNLIYVIIIIAYFIYQAQLAKKRKQQKEEAIKRQATTSADSGDRKVTAPATTVEDRMKEIFREMEMKTKPYARPQQTSPVAKRIQPPSQISQKQSPQKQKKKEPVPFLNVDMTQEEILPEGTPSNLSDGFEKGKVTNFDYNKIAQAAVKQKVNLREAMIANIILNRPEW